MPEMQDSPEKARMREAKLARAYSTFIDYSDKVPDSVKMNQLQNLLHDALVSTDHVQNCCIIRRKEGTVVATSVGFTLYGDQVQALIDLFKAPSQLREDGMTFDDRQYKCVRADKQSIYAKNENTGVIIARTNLYLIVATFSEHMFPSICVEAVEKLADYFRTKGK